MTTNVLEQAGLAVLHYGALVAIFRAAGKRLAGQTTSFDLIVLIGLTVALQNVTLRPGAVNALVFLVVVFLLHRGNATLCRRSARLRRWMRGDPRVLVRDGVVDDAALVAEGLSHDELAAGLRKMGFGDAGEVKLAVLEETGQVSAVRK
jgi:uncharacterized membrane protein YcaP (DUF421 family)